MTDVPTSEDNSATSNSRHRNILLFILLLAINYLIFSPAFVRVFAHDHIYYIAELHGSDRFSDGLQLCDYSVERKNMKGDEILYRPLLFVWMAAESALFSWDHVYWNMANFVLHIVVALL